MMRYIISLLIGLIALQSYAQCHRRPIRVAVIDTGFGYRNHGAQAKLCNVGHKDFSPDQEYATNFNTQDSVPLDSHGHGTNIVGVIAHYADLTESNYCVVVIKYYSTKDFQKTTSDYATANFRGSINAFKYMNEIKPDIVNYSGGGIEYSAEEAFFVKEYLDSGGILVAAAGNYGIDLDKQGNTYYPAMYDPRIIVVGWLNREPAKAPLSNYGSMVKRWEIGSELVGYGLSMSGTSQATAAATGKIVGQMRNRCVE